MSSNNNNQVEPQVSPSQQSSSDFSDLQPKNKNKKIFIVVCILVFIFSILLVGGWYYMNKKAIEQKNQLQAQNDALNQKIQDLQKTTPVTIQKQNQNEQAYFTKYEKINFTYPTTFKLTDTSTAGGANGEVGSDNIVLTNGLFKGTIQTGLFGVGGACPDCKVLLSEPINFLGKSRFLNYVSSDGGPKVDYVVVTDTPQESFGYLKGKNVTVTDGQTALMIFQASYMNGDKQIPKTLVELQNDPNIAAFKQVLTSMKY